jgi:hypothetical protein
MDWNISPNEKDKQTNSVAFSLQANYTDRLTERPPRVEEI